MSVSHETRAELAHYDAKTELILKIMGHDPAVVIRGAKHGDEPHWLDILRRARKWMDVLDILRDAAYWMEVLSEVNDAPELLTAIIRIHTRIEMLERTSNSAPEIDPEAIKVPASKKKPISNKKYHTLIQKLSEAQNWRCCYCSIEMSYRIQSDRSATIEHIYPRSLGGDDDWENLASACRLCNIARGTLDIDLYLSLVTALGRDGAAKRANRIYYDNDRTNADSEMKLQKKKAPVD